MLRSDLMRKKEGETEGEKVKRGRKGGEKRERENHHPRRTAEGHKVNLYPTADYDLTRAPTLHKHKRRKRRGGETSSDRHQGGAEPKKQK